MKFLGFACQGLVALLGIQYSMARRSQTWQDVLLIAYCCIVHSILHIYVFGFFYSLLQIINTQQAIEDNLKEISQEAITFDTKVLILFSKYSQIDCLCCDLLQYFQFYIVAWFSTFFIINSVTVYMIFLMIRQSSLYSFWVIFSIFTIIFKFFDIFLLLACYDIIEVKRGEFRQILIEQIHYTQ